jgi:hypothetical protein
LIKTNSLRGVPKSSYKALYHQEQAYLLETLKLDYIKAYLMVEMRQVYPVFIGTFSLLFLVKESSSGPNMGGGLQKPPCAAEG